MRGRSLFFGRFWMGCLFCVALFSGIGRRCGFFFGVVKGVVYKIPLFVLGGVFLGIISYRDIKVLQGRVPVFSSPWVVLFWGWAGGCCLVCFLGAYGGSIFLCCVWQVVLLGGYCSRGIVFLGTGMLGASFCTLLLGFALQFSFLFPLFLFPADSYWFRGFFHRWCVLLRNSSPPYQILNYNI